MFKAILAGIALNTLAALAAQAAVVINFEEANDQVTLTMSGTLDTTGLTFMEGEKSPPVILPQAGSITLGASGTVLFASGAFSAAPAFGISPFLLTNGLNEDQFVISGTQVAVPLSFTSGDSLNAFSVLSGIGLITSLADAGLTVGTHVYTLPSDTVTVNIGVAAVPIPATLPLLLGAFGLVAVARCRRA